MKTYRIATVPGDGIGKEVVPAAQQVLEALVAANCTFRFEFENFDWGGDHFREHAVMMPENGLDALRNKDDILFGSAGDPDIPDHITLWGLCLKICQGLGQYANVRPTRILPGIDTPLKRCKAEDLDWVIVRENSSMRPPRAWSTVFSVVGMIMRLAPVAAFEAMAFTVGKYGLGSIVFLGKLMATIYLTCLLFVVLVLGGISRISGCSLWTFLRCIKDEIFSFLGTSSSESVVPQLMRKLEFAGVSKPVVRLVVSSGLTFNPDGQCIHYTMAAIFIAQATDTPLTLTDQLLVLGVLLPGVERFMSEARAITDTIGNAVGTVAIARWVGSVDRERLNMVLDGNSDPDDLHGLYEGADAASNLEETDLLTQRPQLAA
ncbi:MAG: Aerobic C4-dicarboxylate transport protein [Accumulibacter sp.]|uniref:cation:dicarboxylate symporter family transporter n=1 Tax=Accumulibacter sp. TaxID=2053492 RepID=UPI0012157CED|nr:cation:dicarboxylase symporter family transporter [Accumulibacter sp.]TLD45811.1 MAG: Aerobic C4-dicarboxylate transport protein [Accumulibacter sp.]